MGFLSEWFERGVFVFLVVFLLFLGLWQGVQVQSFTLDLFFVVVELVFLDAVFSSLGFAVFFLVSAGVFLVRRICSGEGGVDGAEGLVVCVVPSYKDSQVLDRSVGSLVNSDYEELEVVVVVEEDDREGIEDAKQLSNDYEEVDFLVNSCYPGSKAGALNYAVEETDSEFVGLFDSDQLVDEKFVSCAVSELNSSYDVVQGRNVPESEDFLGGIAYFQDLFFKLPRQVTRFITGFQIVLTKTAVFRRDKLDSIGSFDEDLLTEDLDYAFRCYRDNLSISTFLSLGAKEKSPVSFVDLWCQRKRWVLGYFQVCKKNFVVLKQSLSLRNMVSVMMGILSVFGSFFMLLLVSKFLLLIILGASLIYAVPVSVIYLIAGGGLTRVSGSDNKRGRIKAWAASPLIFPLFSLITIKSFIEFLLEENREWYHIKK